MKPINRALPALGVMTVLQLALAQAYAAPLALSNSPLFLTSSNKANVLMMFGNSNSMDEDPTGKAVGSAAASSKSEVARNAIKMVVNNYTGYINMGLLAYQQNTARLKFLSDAQYDVSYDTLHDFDAGFAGARNSLTKKFHIANGSSSGNFINYNVNLPSYSDSRDPDLFCYSTTSCTDPTHDFKGISSACTTAENPSTGATGGPWDFYACYKTKTGSSNGAPGSSGAGYGALYANIRLSPTDSDLGQGITDFGKRLTSQYVSMAWFADGAPGMGYLHVPVANLDAVQAAKIVKKLDVSQFTDNMPTDARYPLQNAGLSPLEGTVLTANHYFAGTLTETSQGGSRTLGAPPNSCSKNFLIALTDGLPSVTKDGVPSGVVATNLSDLTAQVAALKSSTSKTETYVVGFALPYGVSITQLDTIAAAGGSNTAYNANDTATLNSAFARIFSDIIAKTSAASSVALNSPSVAVGAHVYQAKFSSGDWSGQLLDVAIQSDGSLASSAAWDAGQLLATRDSTTRVIVTSKPSLGASHRGVAFRWPVDPAAPTSTELDTAQTTLLAGGSGDAIGSARLDYVRGGAANEAPAGQKWRARPTSKLGDIVNSAPHYVGAPGFNYDDAGYSDFRTSELGRTKMIYVGANDGMLHGFDAASGIEKLAYIPSQMYANLNRLTDANYAHRYFMDGSPNSGDVYYGGAWHTVLVSGMGGGGRGLFGLDVTSPGSFSEASAASVVNFELNETADADLGYIAGPIDIVKMNNGKWAALFGNGYNSGGSGESALFIVDVETGEVITKIKTGEGVPATPNALAPPLSIDTDSNGTVDVVYAGDLLGNMWKFDLSASNPAQWKVDYKLYQAGQPITAAADAGEHPNGGFMVYFGTGKYLEPSDVSSAPGNAMYGIWDKGVAVTGNLVQQTFTSVFDINGVPYRSTSSNPINWTTHNGWYANFPGLAERAVSAPILHGGRVISTSIIPSSAECSPGGTSWLNEIDWLTGGLVPVPTLDTNGDGKVDSSDTLVAGRRLDSVASSPAIQQLPVGEVNLLNQSSGTVAAIVGSVYPKQAKRLSWRQIK